MLTWRLALTMDSASSTPLFLQIAKGLEQAIREGRLNPGDPLPGTRALSEQLQVNRNTVVAAYQELVAEGWVQTRIGGGTFVAATPPKSPSHSVHDVPISIAAPVIPVLPAPADHRPTVSAPSALSCLTTDADPSLFPLEALSRAYHRAVQRHRPDWFSARPPQGSEPLRQALSTMLTQTKGLRLPADGLMTLPGIPEGLTLVCKALLGPGAVVAVEALGSPAVRDTLRAAGAVLHPIPVDEEGLDVGALGAAMARHPIRLVVVTALRQHPTTVSLSAPRRAALLTLAALHHLPILELDRDPGFQYEGPAVLPLAAEDPHGVVIYLGAFSSWLFPNVPLAYLLAAPAVLNRLVDWRRALTQGCDPLLEEALRDLLENGELQRHLHRLQRVVRERRDTLLESLHTHLPDVLDIQRPSGGLACWLKVRQAGLSVERWAERARAQGLVFQPGSDFSFDRTAIPWLRLGFAGLPPSELKEAVQRLKKSAAECDCDTNHSNELIIKTSDSIELSLGAQGKNLEKNDRTTHHS